VNVEAGGTTNGDYANTIARSFLFDAWHMPLQQALMSSKGRADRRYRRKGAVKEIDLSVEDQQRLGDPFR